MDNSESDQYEIGDLPNNFLGKRASPLKTEIINSNRGSSYDFEECMNNLNSISNINPRFAVEIDSYLLQ